MDDVLYPVGVYPVLPHCTFHDKASVLTHLSFLQEILSLSELFGLKCCRNQRFLFAGKWQARSIIDVFNKTFVHCCPNRTSNLRNIQRTQYGACSTEI